MAATRKFARCFDASWRQDVSLDEVEISCASYAYATLIWEKACRYDWPVTIASGLPATLTRPGRALIGLSSWIESDFAAGVLRRLLQSRDLTLGVSIDITAPRAASILAKAEAAWGRATYGASLERLAAKYRTWATKEDLSDDQRTRTLAKANEVDQLRVWIGDLLASIPENDADRPIELQQLVECALNFVNTFAATTSALDGAAASALRDSIAELRALGSFSCSLKTDCGSFGSASAVLAWEPTGPVPGICMCRCFRRRDSPTEGRSSWSVLKKAGYSPRPLRILCSSILNGSASIPSSADPPTELMRRFMPR